jgi:hypothetical protein
MSVLVLGILLNFVIGTVVVVVLYLIHRFFIWLFRPISKIFLKRRPVLTIFRIVELLLLLGIPILSYLYLFYNQDFFYRYTVDTWLSVFLLGMPCGLFFMSKLYSRFNRDEIFVKGEPGIQSTQVITFAGTYRKTTVTFHDLEVIENPKTGDRYGAGPTFEKDYPTVEALLPEPRKNALGKKKNCADCGKSLDLGKALPQTFRQTFKFDGMKPFTLEVQAPMVACGACGRLHVLSTLDLENAEIKACEKGKLSWDAKAPKSIESEDLSFEIPQNARKVYVRPLYPVTFLFVFLFALAMREPTFIVLTGLLAFVILYYSFRIQFQFTDLEVFQGTFHATWEKLTRIKTDRTGVQKQPNLKTDLVFPKKTISIYPVFTMNYRKTLEELAEILEKRGQGNKFDTLTRGILQGEKVETNFGSFVFMGLFSAGLLIAGVFFLNKALVYSHWPETIGLVQQAVIEKPDSQDYLHDDWHLSVGYQTQEGQAVLSQMVFTGFHSEDWTTGKRVILCYDPDHSSKIFLKGREISADWMLGVSLLGVGIFFIVQIFVLMKYFRHS